MIGSEDQLSADRTFTLFTRDAGLLYARAVSVRKEQSKLRYSLQDFSLVRVSLVRGKQGWRIIGAERSHNLYYATTDRQTRGALLRVLKLVRRLVRGEEPHVALYTILIEGLETVVQGGGEGRRGEQVLTLRVISALGYIAPHDAYQHLLAAPSLSHALLLPEAHLTETSVVQRAIDEALVVSQL